MKHLGLFVNTTKPDAIACTEIAAKLAREKGMKCCAAPEIVERFTPETQSIIDAVEYDDFDKHADIVVSFGGDGTILAAAKQFLVAELPIMGVNLGRLGFLAEYTVAELDAGFAALAKGEYIIEERSMLESSISVEGTENLNEMVYAMNDFVIHKKDFARMMTVAATIDGVPVADYHADGLIISTPTGSTAYSLSSGGPIVVPTCSVLVLTPVSPHSLNMRPLVVPDTVEIVLTPGTGSGTTSLVADGQIVSSKEEGERIIIRKSERVVKLLKRVENSYYDLLKNKLLWSLLTKQ